MIKLCVVRIMRRSNIHEGNCMFDNTILFFNSFACCWDIYI
jgi:hypothetical protein